MTTERTTPVCQARLRIPIIDIPSDEYDWQNCAAPGRNRRKLAGLRAQVYAFVTDRNSNTEGRPELDRPSVHCGQDRDECQTSGPGFSGVRADFLVRWLGRALWQGRWGRFQAEIAADRQPAFARVGEIDRRAQATRDSCMRSPPPPRETQLANLRRSHRPSARNVGESLGT